MKNTIKSIAAFIVLSSIFACAPIEDQSLRDKYIKNAGGPTITTAEITKHITVSQPGKTTLEDYNIDVNCDDPSLGGIWHFTKSGADAIMFTQGGRYVYGENGEFEVFYAVPSNGKIVESEHFKVSVKDVLDPWAAMLTGATASTDLESIKTWEFRTINPGSGKDTKIPHDPEGWICEQPGYPLWAYYGPYDCNQDWGGKATFAEAGDQTMTFKFGGSEITTYDKDGNLKAKGTFSFDRTSPDPREPATGAGVKAMGAFKTTVPLPGGEYDWDGQGDDNTFLLFDLTDDILTVGHSLGYPYKDLVIWDDSQGFWDFQIWIAWYKARE